MPDKSLSSVSGWGRAQAGGAWAATYDLSFSVLRCHEPPTGGRDGRAPKLYNQSLFLQTLSRFAVVLPARYDLEAALSELAESVTAVLGLCGSGVTMAEDGRLRFVTAVTEASGELERNQEQQQAGPCRYAYETGQVVRVTDVRVESTRWPEFSVADTPPLGCRSEPGSPATRFVGSGGSRV